MAAIEPTPVTTPPTVPDRSDRANFPVRMYNAFVYLFGGFWSGMNGLADNTYDNALYAKDQADLTAADRVQTGLDAIATAADRVQTGLDASSASASAASAAAIAGSFAGTSASSLLIATGEKTFNTQLGEQYTAGIWMTAVSAADGGNWMFGQVTSYAGSTLVLDVQATGGSGTYSDWNLSLTGARGPAGTGITPQAVGFTATGGAVAKTLTVDVDVTASELIKTHSAVATGAIAAGDFVELMPDGTVRVAQYEPSISTGTEATAVSINISILTSCYDSHNNKIVVVYGNANTGYADAVVGTVSGTTIEFGTPVTFHANSVNHLSCCFDSYNNKVVVFTGSNSLGYLLGYVGTVSGTTIKFGSYTVINLVSVLVVASACCFDTTNNKIALMYNLNNTSGRCCVVTVSGSTFSHGAEATFKAVYVSNITCCYNSVDNKIIIACTNQASSGAGTVLMPNISGTTITNFAETTFETTQCYGLSCCYDPNNNKAVIVYGLAGNSIKAVVAYYLGAAKVGTPVIIKSSSNIAPSACCYDTKLGRIVILYVDGTYSSHAYSTWGFSFNASLIFPSDPVVVRSTNGSHISTLFDLATEQPVLIYYYNPAAIKAVVAKTSLSICDRWLGVADTTVATSETVKISTPGSVVTNQSNLLTGFPYCLTDSGALTIATTNCHVGKALSATSMILERS